uniref:Putative histone h1 n=1 Tax=Culex tarsalis TaxID=7177 RepID=A0A1Q3EVE2_CULTA
MAASEVAEDRSSPEPEATAEEEQEEVPSPTKAKGRGRPKKEKDPKVPKEKAPKVPKEKAPKVPKEKVPRGPGRPKGKAKLTGFETPPIHDMVIEALETLQDRKGVTLQAIKRFTEENYKVDLQRQGVRIRKAVLAGVESGDIIRTHGAGAAGRFKLKPFKVVVANKRAAPEDYVQLPYGKSSAVKITGKIGKFKKAISESKSADVVASSPTKGKRGRPKSK